MLKYILLVIGLLIWIYLLHVFTKADLKAWKYIWGSGGLFVMMMVYLRPLLTEPLAKVVASLAGVFGNLTGIFSSYFKYGVIFIDAKAGSISLQIDFECSGILEIMAFLALLIFFNAYTIYERMILSVMGTLYIILANTLRIIVICCIIHGFGMKSYYVAHTFVGRLIFYGLSILLYFFVFTKTQIVRQKVGGFTYGNSK